MLGKCLKYDLKSLFGVWWIAAVTMLLLSVVGGISERMIRSEKDYLVMLGELGMGLYVLAMVAFFVIVMILIFVRYYQNFFADEGYLTFTLPVRREVLFASKVISAVISVAATLAVMLLCGMITAAIAPAEPAEGMPSYEADGNLIDGVWDVIYAVEWIVGIVLVLLASLLMICLCITLGATVAKKHKVLASVGFYYLFQWGLSLVGTVLVFCVIAMVLTAGSVFPAIGNVPYGEAISALLGLLVCVVLAVVDTVLAFANIGCLERKLNLA